VDHQLQASFKNVAKPVIAGAIIINDKIELEPLTMPTPMIEPNADFNTAALWGNNRQCATFVVIDSNRLIGSILSIISKANATEHKVAIFIMISTRRSLIEPQQHTSSAFRSSQTI
jgi:hypothetical protein